ncbi:MAG: cysteine synthase A [bacterium]|nr:cysteine synthase A [bacterium]
MALVETLLETIGHTPLLQVTHLQGAARCFAKVESFNPGGSVKDRVGLAMIEAAEQAGVLSPGGLIIEPTSGNTGIGLALAAAIKGYQLILTMPETMSIERRKLLAAYGAEIVLTPGNEGMQGAIAMAQRLHAENPRSFIPQQFENPANPEIHAKTTAQEILQDCPYIPDVFVACVGTGGTLTGVARVLKAAYPQIEIVAVEPDTSAVLSGQPAGPHGLQGIGAGFIPSILETSLIDKVLTVNTTQAGIAARTAAKRAGLLVGISSGAALSAMETLSMQPLYAGKNIVTLLPDSGERYLSTWLFE